MVAQTESVVAESQAGEAAEAARPPVSQRKRRANRRNAKKSTGPRTAEGKHRAARNSISHGIFCFDLLLDGEDEEKLAFIRDGFLDALRPQDLLELALVDRIVAAQWRINRCQASERLTYASMASHEQDRMLRRAEKIQKKFGFDTLEELADYCRTHPREDNIDELRAAMASFASLAAMAQLKVTPAISLAAAMTSPEDSLDHGGLQRLSAYEQRFANEQHRALRDLTRLREHAKKWADLPDSPYRQVVEIDDEEDDAEDEDATPSPRMRREGGGEGQGARGDDERSTTVASSTGASSAAARNETTDAARPSPQPSPRAGEREPEWKNEPTAENSAATEVTANSSSGASNTPPVPSKSSPVHDDVEPPSSAPPDEKGR